MSFRNYQHVTIRYRKFVFDSKGTSVFTHNSLLNISLAELASLCRFNKVISEVCNGHFPF